MQQRLPVDTGVSDAEYDLILVLQQALEDCHRYAHFAEDARVAGDGELADLFDELTQEDRELAARLRAIAARRFGTP